MRVWVDRAPWADVVVALGVLGVEDFKDGAGGVCRWSWTDVPGLAGVDGAWGGLVGWVGQGWLGGTGEGSLVGAQMGSSAVLCVDRPRCG